MKNKKLWKEIKNFSVDNDSNELTFLERLARENGWSRKYCLKVYEEYLCFIYLMTISDEILTPSDSVDQVWHLHLTYSKSYWIDLCENILTKNIHHGPTKGGKLEKKRYWLAYERTLDKYLSEFDIKPPSQVWPCVEERFKNIESFRRINLSEVFIIKRKFIYIFSIYLPLVLFTNSVRAESSVLEIIGYTFLVILGIPALFYFIFWVIGRANKKGGGGCGGSGCGGCGGCGG